MKSVFVKRMFLAGALILVTGLSVWGQSDASASDAAYPVNDLLELQTTPQSAVNGASGGLFTSAIDDYIGVTTWQDVEIAKSYVYLGGTADASNAGLIGGYATNLGGARLGIHYNGQLLDSAYGGNDGKEDAKQNKIKGEATWSNNLALLFGSEGIGGIRFDFQFSPTFKSEGENGKEASNKKNKADNTGRTVTSLQWGTVMGDLKPAVTLGFKWPEYHLSEPHEVDGKYEVWNDAALGLKAAVEYKALSVDYQLTVNLGSTIKANKTDLAVAGSVDNRLNVGYTLESAVGEKLTLKAKPAIGLGLNINDPKISGTYQGTDIEVRWDGIQGTYGSVLKDQPWYGDSKNPNITTPSEERPTTWFQIAPSFAVGAKYAVSAKWNLYTGLSFSFLTVNLKGTSVYKQTTKPSPTDDIKDVPSAWSIVGIGNVTPNLGLELHPSDNLSVELGLNGNLGNSYQTWELNLARLSGSLAVNVKL